MLELGGSDPFLILADADLPAVAAQAARSRFLNTGQSCLAAKRFVVEEAVADEFEGRFVEAAEALVVGDPMDPATQVGPLARADLADGLDRQVRESVAKGARVLTGGRRVGDRGCFYAPTVLAGVRPGMPAYDEETFGPVAAVIRVADEAQRPRGGQRHRLRPGRLRLDPGRRPRPAGRPADQVRRRVRQRRGRLRPQAALRRDQAQRLRTRAGRRRHTEFTNLRTWWVSGSATPTRAPP